jgi:hypothetical protein
MRSKDGPLLSSRRDLTGRERAQAFQARAGGLSTSHETVFTDSKAARRTASTRPSLSRMDEWLANDRDIVQE